MNMRTALLLLVVFSLFTLPVLAERPPDAGVERTMIEGEDDWAADNPVLPGKITCPGGRLEVGRGLPYCADSNTGRLHFRGSVLWSCMKSHDDRLTGVGLFTVNGNLDANASGPVWGDFKIVPFVDCNKWEAYPSEVIDNATVFWRGTWNGQRSFDSVENVWIGDLRIVGKGTGTTADGKTIDGLHFKGAEWIVMYTPFPVPYEFLGDPDLYTVAEGYFTGMVKD